MCTVLHEMHAISIYLGARSISSHGGVYFAVSGGSYFFGGEGGGVAGMKS